MRELDRDVRREFAPLDLLERAEVMIAHRGGLGAIRDLLTQLCEHAAETRLADLPGPSERGTQRFSGRDARGALLNEPAFPRLPGHPVPPGRFEGESGCK